MFNKGNYYLFFWWRHWAKLNDLPEATVLLNTEIELQDYFYQFHNFPN